MDMPDNILSVLVYSFFWSRNSLLILWLLFPLGVGMVRRKKYLTRKSQVLCEREKPWFIITEEDSMRQLEICLPALTQEIPTNSAAQFGCLCSVLLDHPVLFVVNARLQNIFKRLSLKMLVLIMWLMTL